MPTISYNKEKIQRFVSVTNEKFHDEKIILAWIKHFYKVKCTKVEGMIEINPSNFSLQVLSFIIIKLHHIEVYPFLPRKFAEKYEYIDANPCVRKNANAQESVGKDLTSRIYWILWTVWKLHELLYSKCESNILKNF